MDFHQLIDVAFINLLYFAMTLVIARIALVLHYQIKHRQAEGIHKIIIMQRAAVFSNYLTIALVQSVVLIILILSIKYTGV